jgi:hypothetical protein
MTARSCSNPEQCTSAAVQAHVSMMHTGTCSSTLPILSSQVRAGKHTSTSTHTHTSTHLQLYTSRMNRSLSLKCSLSRATPLPWCASVSITITRWTCGQVWWRQQGLSQGANSAVLGYCIAAMVLLSCCYGAAIMLL